MKQWCRAALAAALVCIALPVAAQPRTVTATIASDTAVVIVNFNNGDTVDIVATLTTTDPNENGEGEPIVLQSSTGFSGVVSNYAQPTSFSFKASAGGTLSGFIQGFDGDESGVVTVTINSNQKKRFTQEQKDAMAKASADLNVQAAAETVIAALCLAIPDPTITKFCALTSGSLAGVTWLLSAALNRLALDPSDPNFRIIALPVLLTLPPESGGPEIAAVNALILNEERMLALARAAAIAIDRAQGAVDAGDAFWEAQQVAALNSYVSQLTALLAQQPGLLVEAVRQIGLSGFPTLTIGAFDVLNFEFQVAFGSLPAPLAAAMTTLGADAAAQEDIRQLLFVQNIDDVAGTFPALLVDSQLLASLAALVNSLGIVVPIDIKPGSSTNPINRRSNGVIPVAILSSAGFDAADGVDITSLTFGSTGNEPSLARCAAEDVNGDGLADLVCHFYTQLTGFRAADTNAVLKGRTIGGVAFQGTDSIRIVQ